MEQLIFNEDKNQLYVSQQRNETFQDAVVLGDAYFIQVAPSFSTGLITIATRYYALQLQNPSLSPKKVFLQSLNITRTTTGIGVNVTLDTDIALYKGGTLGSGSSVTISKVNPSSANNTSATAVSQGFSSTNPLTGGTLIEGMSIVSSDTTYYYLYNGSILIPPGSTLTLWVRVFISSLLGISASVTLSMLLKYWEENN